MMQPLAIVHLKVLPGNLRIQIIINTKSFATMMLHPTILCTETENLRHSLIGTRQGLDRGFGILLTLSIASFRSHMHKICRSLDRQTSLPRPGVSDCSIRHMASRFHMKRFSMQ